MPCELKSLIEETGHAYKIYNDMSHANTDYAGFAAQSYEDFLQILGRPEMTQQQIRRLLRKGWFHHKENKSQDCWASFLANYVRRNANNR